MKFYLISQHFNAELYAMFSCRGTWGPVTPCTECGKPAGRYIEPLLVQWKIGSTRIADFPTGGPTIVTDRVRDCLIEHGFPCRFGEVQYVAPEKARGFARRDLKKYGRVPFPYDGPHLSWLRPTVSLPVDVERSGLKVEKDCNTCGVLHYRKRMFDLSLVLPASAWNGEMMFTVSQFRADNTLFITQGGLDILQRAGFTNLFVRDGGVITT
jgi:hypothetical protein